MLQEVKEVHLGGALSGMDGEQWKLVARGANCNSIRKISRVFSQRLSIVLLNEEQPNCSISFEENRKLSQMQTSCTLFILLEGNFP